MTELLNRTAFLRQADEVFWAQDAQTVREPVSLLLLDIDRSRRSTMGMAMRVAMPSYAPLPMRCGRPAPLPADWAARSLDFSSEVMAAGAQVSPPTKSVPVALGCQYGCRRAWLISR